jgi:hypothetical protein
MHIKQLAQQIVNEYTSNKELAATVDSNPEPIRCMIYESGLISNPEQLDGTPLYHQLVDAIEEIY